MTQTPNLSAILDNFLQHENLAKKQQDTIKSLNDAILMTQEAILKAEEEVVLLREKNKEQSLAFATIKSETDILRTKNTVLKELIRKEDRKKAEIQRQFDQITAEKDEEVKQLDSLVDELFDNYGPSGKRVQEEIRISIRTQDEVNTLETKKAEKVIQIASLKLEIEELSRLETVKNEMLEKIGELQKKRISLARKTKKLKEEIQSANRKKHGRRFY